MKDFSFDAFSNMSDEELDEFFRPRKMNSRKTLASLFVYLILKEQSSPEQPLLQQDILKKLQEYPYELTIERKALSRIIHLLVDSQLGIISVPKVGTFYDRKFEKEQVDMYSGGYYEDDFFDSAS